MNFNLPACSTAGACVDSGTAAALFAVVITSFALGYGIGQLVLWTRRLSEVA
jgi:hypothetical protein